MYGSRNVSLAWTAAWSASVRKSDYLLGDEDFALAVGLVQIDVAGDVPVVIVGEEADLLLERKVRQVFVEPLVEGVRLRILERVLVRLASAAPYEVDKLADFYRVEFYFFFRSAMYSLIMK